MMPSYTHNITTNYIERREGESSSPRNSKHTRNRRKLKQPSQIRKWIFSLSLLLLWLLRWNRRLRILGLKWLTELRWLKLGLSWLLRGGGLTRRCFLSVRGLEQCRLKLLLLGLLRLARRPLHLGLYTYGVAALEEVRLWDARTSNLRQALILRRCSRQRD